MQLDQKTSISKEIHEELESVEKEVDLVEKERLSCLDALRGHLNRIKKSFSKTVEGRVPSDSESARREIWCEHKKFNKELFLVQSDYDQKIASLNTRLDHVEDLFKKLENKEILQVSK